MSIKNILIEKITEFLKVRGEKLKLDIITQVSKILSQFIVLASIGVVIVFLLIFLSIGLGAYFNQVLDSSFGGYYIVSAIYFAILIGLIILMRSNRVQDWLESMFIGVSNIEEEDEQ